MKNLLHDFDVVRMNNSSLTLKDKGNGEYVYITRKLFNNLENVEEIRVIEREHHGCITKWIEGRYWSRF